jgi:hypothetical protein
MLYMDPANPILAIARLFHPPSGGRDQQLIPTTVQEALPAALFGGFSL